MLILSPFLQAFNGKLSVRRLIIEQALQQGKQFLSKHEGSTSSGRRGSDESLLLRVIENLRKQLAQVEDQWKQLLQKSEEWQKILDEVIHVGFIVLSSCSVISAITCDQYRSVSNTIAYDNCYDM